MPKKLKYCPNCNSTRFTEILYSMPKYDEDINNAINEGKIILGDLCKTENCPDYKCFDCNAFIYSNTRQFELRDEDFLGNVGTS